MRIRRNFGFQKLLLEQIQRIQYELPKDRFGWDFDQKFVLVIKKGYRVVSFDNLETNEEKLSMLARLSHEKLLVVLLNDRSC